MKVRSGVTSKTPENVFIDAGAIYFNYGLANETLLGATRGGNEFNTNRVSKNIEADGIKGAVKGMKRITEVNPQITVNMLELSIDNLVKAIAGANQSDRISIDLEHIEGDTVAEFDLNQNDVVENSEKVFVKGPLTTGGNGEIRTGLMVEQTRSKKYASRFVGANAANNKEFETSIGSWINAATKGILEVVTLGLPGNCLKFTGETGAGTTFLTLPGGNGAQLTNLVEDEYYRLQIAIKIETGKWTGPGTVIVHCDNGATAEITPDTTWKSYVIVFKATGTNATITLVAQTQEPSASNEIKIDSLELEKVDYPTDAQKKLGQIGYVINWGDNKSAVASVIFMDTMYATDEIVLNYTYVPATASDAVDTTITGGEIEDSDYITNVAVDRENGPSARAFFTILKNALAEGPFSLSTAPRDEAVPVVIFTGHYLPDDLDTEPWEIRYPKT